jgi:hypothetical protein
MKKLIEALQILMKYDPDGSVGGADHDIIYLAYVDTEVMSDADNKRMEELGCHLDDNKWCMFV